MFKMSIIGGHTHAYSRVGKSFTALLMDVCGKADQISCNASLNSAIVLASVAACVKTPALAPNVIIQWIEVG